ncbi:MAG: hypothetical protein P1P84_08535 [Deferrisomatales bacterium]|nr:hypothetical protein [Deferrisomatales bacterium]
MTLLRALEALVGVIPFCIALLLGARKNFGTSLGTKGSEFLSAAAGAAVAYAFVHILPVLERTRFLLLREVPDRSLPLDGLGVYLFAMAGFVGFYGVDQALFRPRNGRHGDGHDRSASRLTRGLHLSGVGVYVGLLAYFLVRGTERTASGMALYAGAMALHLLSLSHTLRKQHGDAYERAGVRILAGCVLVGWVCGVLWAIPHLPMLPLIALVAGAILASAMVTELSEAQGGHFLLFAGSAAAYAGLLLVAH